METPLAGRLRGNSPPCRASCVQKSTTPGKQGFWRLAFFGLFLVSAAASGRAAPLSGELEYTGRYSRFDGDSVSSSSTSNLGTLRLRKSMYLWEPWFAQLSGSLGFSLTRSRSWGGQQPSRAQTGELTTGDAQLGLLPQSDMPLNLWVSRNDTRLTNEALTGNLLTDRTVTRYGFQQSYRSSSLGRYQLRFEDTTVTQVADQSLRDERQNWRFSGQKNFSEHDLDLTVEQNEVRRSLGDVGTDERDLFNLRHRYNPQNSNLTVNNLASMTRQQRDTERSVSSTDRDQISTTTIWTSGGQRRLRLSGNLRALEFNNESGSSLGNQQLVATNLGASYRLSDRWTTSASSGATYQESSVDSNVGVAGPVFVEQRFSQQHNVRLGFNSGSRNFADLTHSWNADLSGGYQMVETEQDNTEFANGSIRAGQNLRRPLATGDFGRLTGTLRQSASHQISNSQDPLSGLQHGASITLDSPLARGSAYSEIQVSDSRQYRDGELARVFQLANLQLSLRQNLSRNQTLALSATLQASRSSDSDGFSDWNPSTNVSMSYLQSGLFGMNRLRWRSDLRYTSDNLLYLVQRNDSLEANDDTRWENRLDYSIGLLVTEFTATLSESNDSLNQSYRLSVRRGF
jgi:hypothetical protein